MTREEAIEWIRTMSINYLTRPKGYRTKKRAEALSVAIEALQAEPVKHGKWVHEGIDYMTGQECWDRLPCFCSECKQETRAYFHNFCPNCGAKMDGGV